MKQAHPRTERAVRNRYPRRLSIYETEEGVALLQSLAELRGVSATAVVRQLIRDAARSAGLVASTTTEGNLARPAHGSSETRPVWEEIAEIVSQVPDEDLDTLPADLAEQHDHYLYGSPKR